MDIEWKLTDWDFTLWPHKVVGAVTHSVAVADPLIDTCCPTICRTGDGGYKKETGLTNAGVSLMRNVREGLFFVKIYMTFPIHKN